ncbi:MAG: peptide deformylase [Bacteroidia bacterium]|nr:peptide deformylase [Bacteroidia bacterium]
MLNKIGVIILIFLFIFQCGKDDIYYTGGHNGPNRITLDTPDIEPVDTLAWTKAEMDTISNAPDSMKMRLCIIDNFQDSLILRSRSKNVRPDSSDTILIALIDRMYKTVKDPENPGVGIAAPQVGINRNVIWVQRQDKTGYPFEFYLNPEILQVSAATGVYDEHCLSIPNPPVTGNVIRPYGIHVRYDRLDGKDTSEIILHSFTSRIFQHEIDHLHGVLYIDYLDTNKNMKLMHRFDIMPDKY